MNAIRIKVTVGLNAATLEILDRIVSLQEGKIQTSIDALTERLKVSRNKLAAVVSANPDPNPND